jgi:hypothetical protein
MRESSTHSVQHTHCGWSSVCVGGVAVASWLGFAPLAGCNEVNVAFALGLFGFPSSRVSSLKSDFFCCIW